MPKLVSEYLTEAEYLSLEATSASRSEFLNGHRLPKGTGSRAHSLVCGNLAAALMQRFEASRCRTFMSTVLVRIPQQRAYFYPDVMVACGAEVEIGEPPVWIVDSPLLVAEVLAPDTAEFDRGTRWVAYRSLPSLRHYLLVSPESRRIEAFTRDDSGRWTLAIVEEDDATGPLRLDALGVSLNLSGVFDLSVGAPLVADPHLA